MTPIPAAAGARGEATVGRVPSRLQGLFFGFANVKELGQSRQLQNFMHGGIQTE
jgi:hypothetical protein